MADTMKKNRFLSTQELCYTALGAALTAICAWISIPAQVPFTLQTFAVFLVTGLLGLKCGMLSVTVYLLLGAVGLPVFAGFSSKLMFAQAAVEGRSMSEMLLVMAALGVSSILNGLYFIRTLIRIYSEADEKQRMAASESGAVAPRQRSAAGSMSEDEEGLLPMPGRSRYSFLLSAGALTACNLFLGLFSWVALGWIYRGLAMFL